MKTVNLERHHFDWILAGLRLLELALDGDEKRVFLPDELHDVLMNSGETPNAAMLNEFCEALNTGELDAPVTVDPSHADIAEALRPFAHPDFSKQLVGNSRGDASPVYGRDRAEITLGDFRRAARMHAALTTNATALAASPATDNTPSMREALHEAETEISNLLADTCDEPGNDISANRTLAKIRNALDAPVHVPRVLVTVSGGNVQSIESDADTDVIVLDFDTECSDADTFETPQGSRAFVIAGPFEKMTDELSALFDSAKAHFENQ